jgi:hypothetical protein
MKRKLLYTLLFGTVIVITGCGGGGGGGSSYVRPDTPATSPATVQSQVPFSTPTKIATLDPLATTTYNMSIMNSFTADLTGNGTDNVVIAGRESSTATTSTNWKNSKLSVFGWSNGQLVDQTAQWFSGTDNIIKGTEPSVKFGNFTGNGKSSMYIAPSTDGNVPTTQAQIFVNNGTNFTRKNVDLGYSLWSHDSTTFNWNGYDNIVSLDYGPNGTFIFGNNTGTFTAKSVNNWAFGGSSIAAGDFLNNGSTSFIVTDTGNIKYSTRLFSWSMNGAGDVSVTDIATLPMPRFELPKYDSILGTSDNTNGNRSHNIRVLSYDWDNTGSMDAIVISRPARTPVGNYPVGSEIQFLKNNGGGNFTDVTDTIVVNYDTKLTATYNPVVMDVNNDGLKDIVLSGAGVGNTQVLVQTREGKYVASYGNVIEDFQNQVKSILGTKYDGADAATVNFVKGPNGEMYLLDLVPVGETTSQKALYLSKIGVNASAPNAQATITAIKQTWPWMSDASVNSMLNTTGKSYFGATIIDQDAVWNPVGQLNLSTANGLKPINGYITGVQFDRNDLQVVSLDQYRRSFMIDISRSNLSNISNSYNLNSENIDQHDLTSHTEYLINGSVNNVGPLRVGAENPNLVTPGTANAQQFKNYSIGIPRYWSQGNWSLGAQYTTLNQNPWMSFGGAWGQVNGSATLDHVLSYNQNGFTARAGTMYTTTNFVPGLITNVSPILGAWGETGYRFSKESTVGELGLYAGVKPVILSGNIQANLPTSIDNNGNIAYTNKTLAIQNQTTGYIRALWTTNISKNSVYRVSGTTMTNGQYRLMNEVRFFFD